MRTGKIIQVSGSVVDVRFPHGELPRIREALSVELNGKRLVMEVEQHLSAETVRCIMLSGSEGLSRGMTVTGEGSGLRVPVGKATLALIGAGKQGRNLLHAFLGQPNLVVTAVCDCDRVRREDRARVVNDYYAANPQLGVPGTACRAVADFHSIPERCIAPVWRMRPYFAAAAITAFASSTVWVSGFSQ